MGRERGGALTATAALPGHRTRRIPLTVVATALSVGLVVLTIAVALTLGPANVSLVNVRDVITNHLGLTDIPVRVAADAIVWQERLPRDLSAWAWAQAGRSAALKLSPDAAAYYRSAWAEAERAGDAMPTWSDETFAWAARAALRTLNGSERWPAVQRAIDHLSAAEQRQQPAPLGSGSTVVDGT